MKRSLIHARLREASIRRTLQVSVHRELMRQCPVPHPPPAHVFPATELLQTQATSQYCQMAAPHGFHLAFFENNSSPESFPDEVVADMWLSILAGSNVCTGRGVFAKEQRERLYEHVVPAVYSVQSRTIGKTKKFG